MTAGTTLYTYRKLGRITDHQAPNGVSCAVNGPFTDAEFSQSTNAEFTRARNCGRIG